MTSHKKSFQPHESIIQKLILDYLSLKKIFHFRASIGGLPFQLPNGKVIIKKNPMTGCPDILGIIPNSNGRLFAIEVKTKTGRLSEAQKAWMEDLTKNQVAYCLARSLEDVISFIRTW